MYEEEDRPFNWPRDPFKRELEVVRRQRELATGLVEQLGAIIETAQSLTLGREAGDRLIRRLEVSCDSFARMAERDNAIVAELEQQESDPEAWAVSARAHGTFLVRHRQAT